jgi:hypothetical protein
MNQVCASCGAAAANDAAFCASCGHAIKRAAASTKGAAAPKKRRWGAPTLFVLGILAMAALYFWLFVADDLRPDNAEPAIASQSDDRAEAQIFFTMTEVNIRDKPAMTGSVILGKMPRGSQLTGIVRSDADPSVVWLELSDGNGFVALANLSQVKPPVLVKFLDDQIWAADGALDVWATTLPDSNLLDRVSEGTQLTLLGTTEDNFIEVKLSGDRYGYLNDAQAIIARLGGKPIMIGFNPQTCAFSGEIGAEFAKIGAQLRAQWQALEAKEFANEAARQKAYAAVEGKSKYLRLRRSFEGLSLTGLAQHYESQSLYFDDSPAKVMDIFRAQGFDIGRDGLFTGTELYAGIAATRGEGAAYGKTELGCGV